ncbi:MAG: transcription antitermination factor NusB [Anaerolineae bacterium]
MLTELPDFNAEDAEVEVIEHPEAATDRSAARRVALQILYELDCVAHPVGEVIANRLQEEDVPRKVQKYVHTLAEGVIANLPALDTFIQRYASEFPLDQVAIVDRNILRMAVFELAAQQNTAISVIIAEAMELANLYGAEGSLRFVNGVLGAIANENTDESRQLVVSESEKEE